MVYLLNTYTYLTRHIFFSLLGASIYLIFWNCILNLLLSKCTLLISLINYCPSKPFIFTLVYKNRLIIYYLHLYIYIYIYTHILITYLNTFNIITYNFKRLSNEVVLKKIVLRVLKLFAWTMNTSLKCPPPLFHKLH